MEKEILIECSQCRGTGLYAGMAERAGVGVVCGKCDGTGAVKFKYTEFTGRNHRGDMLRVHMTNPGANIGTGDEGGMPYGEWINGKGFSQGHELRSRVCPAMYYQSADYSKVPKWEQCIHVMVFTECPMWAKKSECWARWDNDQMEKAGKETS